MQPFGAHRVEAGEVEALEDVEDEQRDDPLPVGRALVDVEAPVVRADGLHRLRLEGGEVVRRHQAAVVLKVGHDVVGDGAFVERGCALLRDQAERLRQRRQAMEIAGSGRPPAGQVDSARVLAGVELLRGARPVVRDPAMDDVSLLGIADGGLEDLVEALGPVVREQPLPGADRARHGDGVRALEVDGVDALLLEPLDARRSRRPA